MLATIYKLRRDDWKALGLKDRYSIHKAVYSLFPKEDNDERDFLFVEKDGDWNERNILIISRRAPALPAFGEIQTKEIPQTFLQWDCYGFEITLNPTKRDNSTGKITAVRGKEQLSKWFFDKAPSLGFSVDAAGLQISNEGVVRFNKNGSECTYNTATFIGKLKVTDRNQFINSFEKGIGRAKGFGFGLLQLLPLVK